MHVKKLFNFDFFLNINLIFKLKNIIPDFNIQDLSQLQAVLKNLEVEGLIFDIDQTIVPYRKTDVSDKFSILLQDLAKHYKCCLLSNLVPSKIRMERLKKIEEQVKIKAVLADKKKPAPEAFQQALDFLDLPPQKTIMIGDRLFTDVIGANHLGIRTVLSKPLTIKNDPIFQVTIPRLFENLYLKFARLFIS